MLVHFITLTDAFTDAWNNSKCDPTQLHPTGNDVVRDASHGVTNVLAPAVHQGIYALLDETLRAAGRVRRMIRDPSPARSLEVAKSGQVHVVAGPAPP